MASGLNLHISEERFRQLPNHVILRYEYFAEVYIQAKRQHYEELKQQQNTKNPD